MRARPIGVVYRRSLSTALLLAFMAPAPPMARAQTTTFTYQGQLSDAGTSANGNYDLQFALFDAATAGTQIGSMVTRLGVAASGGVFTVQLDFGVNAFPGADRFLQIGVRPAGGSDFTTLAPRQQISASPYAIRTLSAATADALSTTCTACVQDAQIKAVTGSKVTGTIPVASVPAGSGNYIQNTTSPQAGANFNVGGNGTVGGNLTVNGTLNANVSGNFVQNRTTPQTNTNFDISGNGTLGGTLSASKVGVGTTTPGTPLDVRGNLTLDSGADAVVYTGTSNAEQNRYVDLINSPAAPSASGLKAGGVLVADSYGYANPGKNDVIVKGNVGVGTAAPESKLDVAGRGTLAGPFRGVTIDQTINTASQLSGYALQVRTTSQGVTSTTTSTDFFVNNVGNVGVGTDSPHHRLSIANGVPWTTAAWGGALELTNGEALGWQADVAGKRFGIGASNGGLFFFRTASDPGDSTKPATYDMLLADSGNVGIGTTDPSFAKLVVNDASLGKAVGGISPGAGVFGESTSATGWGVYGKNVAGGYAMYAEGNVSQSRDKGGWVKAMAYVLEDGTIARCYNGMTGVSTGDCGFTVTRRGVPRGPLTDVDFGFPVNDRFVAITPGLSSRGVGSSQTAANFGPSYPDASEPTVVEVDLFYADEPTNSTNAPFFIFVF